LHRFLKIFSPAIFAAGEWQGSFFNHGVNTQKKTMKEKLDKDSFDKLRMLVDGIKQFG
jgi:hypothetical protein